MKQAVRAIITHNDKILLMLRKKNGEEYYTLVGGQVAEGEDQEQALAREVFEETGLKVAKAQLVFIQNLEEPYSSQFIYACDVGQNPGPAALQAGSEEDVLNKSGDNMHYLQWVDIARFKELEFRTSALQSAVAKGLADGFPNQPTVV